MRDAYYEFIRKNAIQDSLSWIEDIPYSKKLNILEEILTIYNKETLNRALNLYEKNYIEKHRVVSYMIRNTLVSLCKTIKLQEDQKQK